MKCNIGFSFRLETPHLEVRRCGGRAMDGDTRARGPVAEHELLAHPEEVYANGGGGGQQHAPPAHALVVTQRPPPPEGDRR
eukprot:694392-Pyramimonas_sp.AAC.1